MTQIAQFQLWQRSMLNEASATKWNSSKFTALPIPHLKLAFVYFLTCYHRLAANKTMQDRRVNARQAQLVEVFQASSQLFNFNTFGFKHVWVDSNFLRRLFSIHDNLDDLFEVAAKSISARSPCLCEHRRLHPRVARGGESS